MPASTLVVVDTDAVSYIFNSHPLAASYQAILSGKSASISLITLAEVEYGMQVKNRSVARRSLMRRFLEDFTTLLPDADTARLWARLKSDCDSKGRPTTFADSWIAATAMQVNAPLVTHNARHYSAIDNLVILTLANAP
jgi:predicted nucleic acid-binding protein